MGVPGSGKTTVGTLLARRLGWDFADADEFHSAENKAKMHQGIPLTDADRAPWLAAIHERIAQWLPEKTNVGPARSGAKQKEPPPALDRPQSSLRLSTRNLRFDCRAPACAQRAFCRRTYSRRPVR